MSNVPHIINLAYAKPVPVAHERCVSSLLSDNELQRAAGFRGEADRLLFATGRALLRTELSEIADVAPTEWQFTSNCHGRPEIVRPQRLRHLRFNVSHTQGLVMCAISNGIDVGVDAEFIQEPPFEIVDCFFSPSEAAAIRRTENPRLAQAFFRYWTLKEAYVKARGLGMSLDLNSFTIEIGPGNSISLRVEDGLPTASRQWQFRSFQPLPSHLAAICLHVRDGKGISILERWVEAASLA